MSDDRLARLYLLGFLDDVQRAEVEDRLTSGGEFAETVETVESDLIDAWTAGELAADEAARFNLYLASHPHAERRLRFSRALGRAAGKRRPVHRRYLAIAATLLIAAGIGYLGQNALRQPGHAPRTVSVTLEPGGLRSESLPRMVTIPAATEFADIAFAESTAARTARIRFIDSGKEVWTGPVRNGVIRVPAAALASGDHAATTLGETNEEIEDYVFRVIR